MTLEIPFLGMMVLTSLVWAYMYYLRLTWMAQNKINPQKLSNVNNLPKNIPEALQNCSNNFSNLFELPVIFYVLVLYLVWENQAGAADVYLAYAFFIGRIIHSIIQCSYNRVSHRFVIYVVSSSALWAMMGHTLVGLF